MREAMHADASAGSLLVSLYVIGQLAGIVASAAMARRSGAGKAFRLCAAVAGAGSALALASNELAALVLARFLQGLGQGALLPMGAAIVAATVAPKRQGKWIGALSLAYGAAFLIAIVATPFVLGLAWHAPFAVTLVLAIVSAALMPGRTPAPLAAPSPRPSGALLPLLAVAVGTGVGQAAIVYLPTLAILRLGVAPTQTSPLMLPLVVLGFAATIGITMSIDRVGARALLAAGAIATIAAVGICAWGPATALAFGAGTALFGAGITGLSGGPLRYAAARSLPVEAQSAAQASVALATNVGVLAGSLLIGFVASIQSSEREALQVALFAAAMVMAAAFVPIMRVRFEHPRC